MYPVLIAAFAAQATKNYPDFPDGNYPRREGFKHLPILSYCRNQALSAIKETGSLTDLTHEDNFYMRWRASVPDSHIQPDWYDSRLELFVGKDNEPLRLVYTAPLCGHEFEALPLVLRLGLELLIRKECRGSDPE